MKLVKLSIAGAADVDTTFDYSACLVGDAVIYNVNKGGRPLGKIATALVPDEGDDNPPTIEVQDDSLIGVTSKGRPVMVFRSGGRNSDGSWNNRAELWMGVGAALPFHPLAMSVIVQTTQAGPKGDKGDKGDNGARGAQGAAGTPGKDAQVDQATIDTIATAVAERVFSLPPAADHFGLPVNAQSGTRFQDMQTISLINQAVQQEIIKAVDEAFAGLIAGGYKSKAQ